MDIPVLGPYECQVWWADPRLLPVGEMSAVLSGTEAERADALRLPEDRRRFVTAAWLLRTVVAAQLGVAPEMVPVLRRCPDCGGAHGRPRVLDAEWSSGAAPEPGTARIPGTAQPLHVSISHSGDRVAVAVCSGAEVGVDVEAVAEAPVTRSVLAPGEWAALRALAPHRQRAGFARMWVRKEAALKGTGHGLRVPPDQVLVSGPLQPPELYGWPLGVSPGEVRLHELDPGEGYVAALAVVGGGDAITVAEYHVTRAATDLSFDIETSRDMMVPGR